MKKRLDITLIKKMFLLSLWTVPVVSQADDIVCLLYTSDAADE